MKQFAAFIHKEFLHILRDRRTLLIVVGIPIVEIILFGFAISTEVRHVRLAVVCPPQDEMARTITDRFAANPYFDLVEPAASGHDIEGLFRTGRADLVVVFGNNFGENLSSTGRASVQLIADATDPNKATIVMGYASGIIASYGQEAADNTPPMIEAGVRMLYNPQMKSAYNFVPGVIGLILMLICAMMTAISIVREKETGTMEVLLVSPVRPIWIILAKAVPYLVVSVFNLCTILLLSVLVLGVPVAGNPVLFAILCVIFIIVSLSLGLLISSVVKTQVAAMLASGMGLMMPTMLLSGLIFPVESMPLLLRIISAAIPARWFVDAVRKVMIQGLGATDIAKELIILSAMAVILIIISLKKFKVRLQ